MRAVVEQDGVDPRRAERDVAAGILVDDLAEQAGAYVQGEGRLARVSAGLGPRAFVGDEKKRQRQADEAEVYDAADDFARSLEDCYAAVRARKAKGGAGWP